MTVARRGGNARVGRKTSAAYDLVILSNVPAAALPAERMESIRRYVTGGGGLIAIGGDQSFTPGGYRGTPLEDILPVRSEARKDKPKPTLAMVLVLDCSGSMEGKSITLAKQATRRAIGMLGPRTRWASSPSRTTIGGSARCTSATTRSRSSADWTPSSPAARPTWYPPLDKAYLALRESPRRAETHHRADRRRFRPGRFRSSRQADHRRGDHAFDRGHRPGGHRPAFEGHRGHGGRALLLLRRRGPRAADLRAGDQHGRQSGHYRGAVLPAGRPGVARLAGLDLTHAPTLLGYVETQAKPDSQLLLATKGGDPLLVVGRSGRGASVAFTSDIQSRWAAAWLRWPEFGRFWAQLVRGAMPQGPAGMALPTPGFAEEFRIKPPNMALLQAIARQSGGRYDPPPAELLSSSGRTVLETILSWREWLLAAVVLFVVDFLSCSGWSGGGVNSACGTGFASVGVWHWLCQCCRRVGVPSCCGQKRAMAHRKTVRHFHELGHLHELTFSCYRRMPLLTNDSWREKLARCVDAAGKETAIELVGFVFMPEHVHLLVYPTAPNP